ncbi:alkaline phosphatase family protein [Oerskovia rustica]|uniref:Uncharacterized protein n=1 Tax=Oerskovia rustica TaxID=2762237 RepID=A0ABR8RTY3_9CELL|nr:hypothetical protein [Oerskovia rustica]MBD7951257.1 hypothetical protein [Oerskovia rustica]
MTKPAPVQTTRRTRRRGFVALLLALTALVGTALPAAAVAATPTAGEPATKPTVVVGIGGLHWSDVSQTSTPTLWTMLREGSAASISVRTATTVTCPVDAWLTLSTGGKPLPPQPVPSDDPDQLPPDPESDESGSYVPLDCLPMPTVQSSTPGTVGPGQVVGWESLTVDPTVESSPPVTHAMTGTPGTLGTRISATGACSTAVGPGGAIALADETGAVSRYATDLTALSPEDLTRCPVTVVDLGELPSDPTERREALQGLDETLSHLVDTVPTGSTVVVAGVSDTPVEAHGLQVVVEWRKGTTTAGWLASASTRRPGIVTLADLAATIGANAGADVSDLQGSPLEVDEKRRMSTERTVENRRYLTEMSNTSTFVMPMFVGAVVLLAAAAVGGVLLGRRRRAGVGPVATRLAVAALLLAATAPAGAYLAALSRWWVSSAPTFTAALWCVVGTVAVALVAWFLSRALPPGRWRLAASAAGITWLILTVDGLTGTVLQQGSILGSTPSLGARFYGFGNMTFAVYAASALVLAGAVAAWLGALGRRRAAIVATSVIGVVTVVIDGWPAFGADFGGIIALVPAFTVLVVGVAGARFTVRRVAAAAVLTVVVVGLVAAIDWLRPGKPSHLGTFFGNVLDGDALGVIASKAAGAWATVANLGGAAVTLLCVAACLVLVGPVRFRPAGLRAQYETWPHLRTTVVSVVTVAVVGTLANDSGIVVAAFTLVMAACLLGAAWFADGRPGTEVVDPRTDAPVRRMPAVVLSVGGALLAVVLLALVVVPAPKSLPAAGAVPSGRGELVAAPGTPVVVVGTSGVRWTDLSPAVTPTLWGMMRDGASAGGISPGVTGRSGQCAGAGWLALSAGRAPVTGEVQDGTWGCAPWRVEPAAPADDGSTEPAPATVSGWEPLTTLQASSEFKPRLGVLGDQLADGGVCATAVGPGAALALAGTDGSVERYLGVEQALADPAAAFSCPVTMVDAGAAPFGTLPTSDTGETSDVGDVGDVGDVDETVDGEPAEPAVTAEEAEAAAEAQTKLRETQLRAIDSTVRRVLRASPTPATVLVVDVGNPAGARPTLGVALADAAGESTPRFLSAASTKWEGVVRLLDVPTTVLDAATVPQPSQFTGAPLVSSAPRPTDVATSVDQLADLTLRDHALRGVAGSVTTIPLWIALAILAAALFLVPRLATKRPRSAQVARRVADGTLLFLAAMPAGLFLMTTWAWWRFSATSAAMWAAMIGCTAIVAGIGGLAPRRPTWAGPALIAGITFAVLTLDAVLGTPLHRGSPLGPSPTLGGRFYGYGNPTYSVYVVAALFTAAAVATILLRRGHKVMAVLATAGIGAVATVVDLWPTLGADVGGGLVLVPACAVLVLHVANVRVTWQRLFLIGVAGVLLVGVIGVLDWMQPVAERSHLGIFVQSVIDGTAWETIARKAGYALRTVTSGVPAWLTLVIVIATALMLWRTLRWNPRWFARTEEQWPILRPLLLALLLAALGGAVVNDYGVRIATVMLFTAVPLVGLLALRSAPVLPGDESARTGAASSGVTPPLPDDAAAPGDAAEPAASGR